MFLTLVLFRIAHTSLSPLTYIAYHWYVAFIADETASRAPANLAWVEQRMPKRSRFKQTTSLKERLAEEATRLRKQAQDTPPGFERELWFARPGDPRQLLK
jgi:hypothetical protein